VTEIIRGGQAGAPDDISISQGDFRDQLATITDAVRQLSGSAEIAPGAVVNDPLNAPYVLYVNPYTGKDTFVSGSYSTSGTATERIELQRLECGYTEARPFKTVNRAIIEAGIITAKSYYTSPLSGFDLVSIILMPGVNIAYNAAGTASVAEWTDGKEPTSAELAYFNPTTTGGILLPRGVSLCGIDLRKTIFRPDVVPAVADEAADYSNRRSIFKVTGTGYYFGFTFMDNASTTASHHLLDCFQFASETELDEFYSKIVDAFGGANNTGGLDNALAVTKQAEYQIVGPQPAAGSQNINTDTTTSASPYIFNCSIRSNYGLCGIFADGSKPTGFRSMVTANYTGVSLQRDLDVWQKYSGGTWGAFADYDDYITTTPDNVRMDPNRRSFHVRAINEAVIQEVSVFAIGQGVHHWTESGGEITITNSNSNFGGCAAVSDGYRDASFAADTDWNVGVVKVSDNLSGLSGNVRRIYLGTVQAVSASSITLVNDLGESATVSGVPDVVARDNYTLREDSYVWVENPLGKDWRTTFTASAWSTADADLLNTTAALEDEDGVVPGTNLDGDDNAIGKRVYVRRLVDIRTPEQRRYTLKLSNTGTARLPVRDYVLQTDTSGASIDAELAANEVLLINSTGNTSIPGVAYAAEVTLRRGNTSVPWSANSYYKKGETVKQANKHYTCIKDNDDAVFDSDKWQESFVHMESSFNPEDFYKNEAPIITFDDDTDGSDASTNLGYNLATVWSTNALIRNQYRAASDYRALHLLLVALGFSSAQAHTILTPQPEADRELDPSVSADMGGFVPSGAANALANWPVEMRRPSVIRLFGHAWEWSGYLNYTKAIPAYQQQLSAQNKFTYYFTNKDGGRVYATGFNEEGYQVTPRGLEDISTGETLSVESLGASDLTIDQPTELTNLTLNGTTTINDTLNINATTTFGQGAQATTTRAGVGEIASISEIEDTGVASTDAGLDSAGNNFITAAGLKYWASWAKVLTQRTGAATLYVCADDASDGDTVNFDGTSATLAADPDRSGDNLADDPPTRREKAVRLSRAVDYANDTYSSLETVNYFLANGPYYTPVTFEHVANVYGARNQFGDFQELADFTAASTGTTSGAKATYDSKFNAPTFATKMDRGENTVLERIYFQGVPTKLEFNYGGRVEGLVWLGVDATLNDTANFPNSIYASYLHSYRTSTVTVQNFIDSYITATYTSSYQFDKFYGTDTIVVGTGDMIVRDCIFGPKASGNGSIGYGVIDGIVRVNSGDCSVRLNGIYLMGNITVSSFPLAAAKGITVISANTYGTRNCQALITNRSANSTSCHLTFDQAYIERANPIGEGYDYDYDKNCIHVLDSNGNYGLMANRATGTATQGATLRYMFGPFSPGSSITTGGSSSYPTTKTNANGAHGIAGVFGDNPNGEGPQTFGLDRDPIRLFRLDSYNNVLWQQARTGTLVTNNETLTYTAGEKQLAYDDSSSNVLNLKSYAWRKGIDVNTAQTVGGEMYDTDGVGEGFFG